MLENNSNILKSMYCFYFKILCVCSISGEKTTNDRAWQVACEGESRGHGQLGNAPFAVPLSFGALPMVLFQFDSSQERDIKFNLSSFLPFKIIFVSTVGRRTSMTRRHLN